MISGIHSKKFRDKILTICESGCKVYVKFFVLFLNISVSLKLFQKNLNTLKAKKKKLLKTQVLKEYK